MPKNNKKEKLNIPNNNKNIYQYPIEDSSVVETNVITGGSYHQRHLIYQLRTSILRAREIDIVVSFLMESGVRLLLEDLKDALDKGVKIRLLTGNYLGITQPSALYLLKKELDDRIDIRFFNDKSRSFHPKAYIFHRDFESEIYIGSSNLSKSALTRGIEWNYRFSSKDDRQSFRLFYDTFNDLFTNHSNKIDDDILNSYSKNWRKPKVSQDIERFDDYEENDKNNVTNIFRPRGVQIEALYALESSREEGADRGLVYAATGIGKTYLAAFDSLNYEKVLFVGHREEILKQAALSFKNIRQSEDYGFFNGEIKDHDKSLIFASVASLGKKEYLNDEYFPRDYFDYIVIDEFHHAVNDSYKRIIEYFKADYILGLTATPDRMDGRNVYELCDYIVPYEISLKDAINKGVLVPFHYYGIYDETVDYSNIKIVNGKYDERELNKKLLIQSRYDLIYGHYMKYPSLAALGFCSSIIHAETMAKEFSSRGIPSVAVHSGISGEYTQERALALQDLKVGKIKVIFSVDMFNEGVDLPFVDMVMFLRPTESPVVFLQQLGRGLRRHKKKSHLNVLDFIGNYRKAGVAPFLLSDQVFTNQKSRTNELKDFDFPDYCHVDFDLRLINMFREMAKRTQTIEDMIKEEYYRIKDKLHGKAPSRLELFSNMEEEIYDLCLKNSKLNPFRNYLEFLKGLNELSQEEIQLYNSIGKDFIVLIETTQMQKSYKMPLLEAFYNKGNIKLRVNEDEVYKSFKSFYNRGTNGQDLINHKGSKTYKEWGKKEYVSKAKDQPIKAFLNSKDHFFIKEDGWLLTINKQLEKVSKMKVFAEHMRDVIDYRTIDYYRRRYKVKNKINGVRSE